MPGHRKEYGGRYSQESIEFWLDDPRIKRANSATKAFFFYCNLIAVKERREVLQPWWDARAIGKACGLDPKTSAKCYEKLSHCSKENSLLAETPDKRIIVCGVKKRHPNLKWKEDDLTSPNTNLNVAQEEEEEEEYIPPVIPPCGGNDDNNQDLNYQESQKTGVLKMPKSEKMTPDEISARLRNFENTWGLYIAQGEGEVFARKGLDLDYQHELIQKWLKGVSRSLGNKKNWNRFIDNWLKRAVRDKEALDHGHGTRRKIATAADFGKSGKIKI